MLLPLLAACAGGHPAGTPAGEAGPAAAGDRPSGPDDVDRLSRLEHELAELRAEYEKSKPAIDRLVQIEGDIRSLVAQLGQVNAKAGGAPAPVPVASAPKPPEPATQAPPAAKPTPLAPPEAVPAPAVKIAAVPLDPQPAAAEGKFGLHLASYQKKDSVAEGWADYRKQYKGILDGLAPRVAPVDLHDGRGILYRLKAGPFESAAAAQAACRKIQTYPAGYCKVVDFSGTPGAEFWGRSGS